MQHQHYLYNKGIRLSIVSSWYANHLSYLHSGCKVCQWGRVVNRTSPTIEPRSSNSTMHLIEIFIIKEKLHSSAYFVWHSTLFPYPEKLMYMWVILVFPRCCECNTSHLQSCHIANKCFLFSIFFNISVFRAVKVRFLKRYCKLGS